MFAWLKQRVSAASEAVAPLLRTNLATMQAAWARLQEDAKELQSQSDLNDPQLLLKSRVPEDLQLIIQALLEEDENTDKDLTGPCFEFLLQNSVIESLCFMGMPDQPTGMRSLITQTLDHVFRALHKPLLPNMNVHLAVRQFLKVCYQKGDLRRKKARRFFLGLLRTLCLKLREDPSLAWVFFEDRSPVDGEPAFVVFEALLSMMNDKDEDASVAVEGLLTCAQLPDDRIAGFIVSRTSFCRDLVAGLLDAFSALPLTDPSPFDEFPPDPAFDTLWTRVKLLDVVAQSTYPVIGEELARALQRHFLDEAVAASLLAVKDSAARWATVLVRRMLERLQSPLLIHAVLRFLLGDFGRAETANEEGVHRVRSKVLRRLNANSEDLTVSTLGLLDTVVALRAQPALENLVLRNLRAGAHLPPETRGHLLELAACEPVPPKAILDLFGLPWRPDDPEMEGHLADAQSEVEVWLNAYERWPGVWEHLLEQRAAATALALREEEKNSPARARPAAAAAGETKEDGGPAPSPAPASAPAAAAAAAPAPAPASAEAGAAAADGAGEGFYEGLFLALLFTKLECIFENSLSTNLRLTSVLARLAACPHPVLHNYLLDPRGPHAKGVRRLLPTLVNVWNAATERAKDLRDFERLLQEAKRRVDEGQEAGSMLEGFEVERFLQGVLVLREFVRELAAIAQAKATLQGLHLEAMQVKLAPQPIDM